MLVWNKTVYFDLETAPADVDFMSLTNSPWLDIRNVGISAYTFVIPVDLYTPNMLGDMHEIEVDGCKFVALQYYNNDDRQQVWQNAVKILDEIAYHIQEPTYVVGFNNNRFDNIAFEQFLRKENMVSRYKDTPLYFADLLPWAHSMGLRQLKDVGNFVSLPKLHSTDDYMVYNLRDVMILVEYLKYLNEHGVHSVAPPEWEEER